MTRKKIGLIAGTGAAALLVSCGVLFGLENNGNLNPGTTPVCEATKEPLTVNKVSTKDVEKKVNEITVHYKWDGEQPHLYYSVDGTDNKTSFPGVPMKDEGNGWYSYTVPDAKEANLIISVPSKDYQTSEFSREKGEYWYSEEGGWSTTEPDNYTEPKEQEVVSEAETKVAADQKVIVHFPGEWDTASIYYWNILPQDKEVAWPGEALEKDENGYYTYTFESTTKANFLFTNGSEQTEDFTQKSGEYWFTGTEWTTKKPGATDDPEETKKPTATTKPGDGSVTDYAQTRTDFRDESIYFLMTTRFYDGDPGNNSRSTHDDEVQNPAEDPSWRGDFKGLAEKLDYIKALGFTSVWITPVVKNWSQYDYHGYHAYNFKEVDSRYCSSDFGYEDLIAAAHEKGIKIIQDVVLNHVGQHGEENLQTLSSNDEATINGSDPNNIYHHDGYIKSWESYQCQNTHIDGNCLDLDTENPAVIDYLVDAYTKYINMGVDAFRIDTVKHISRLGFNNEYIPRLQEAAKNAGTDNFYMFGEVCARDENPVYFSHYACISPFFYTWKETENYAWGDHGTNTTSVAQHWNDYEDWGEEKATKEWNSKNAFLDGNEYHEVDYSQRSGLDVIDFPMHWAFRNAQNAFSTGKRGDSLYNDSTWNVVYVDSHDYAPNTMEKVRYAEGTEAWAENLSLMFTFRGIPCIYYGTEIEFMKGAPIDLYNGKLEDSGRAYFGDHIEGEVSTTDFGVYSNATGEMAKTLNNSLSLHIQRLNRIRQAIPALRKGQYSTDDVQGSMAFKRRYTDDSVDSFVCVTISEGATFTGLPGGTYTDAVTGDVQEVSEGGTLTIDAPGKGNLRVYVLDTAKTKAPGKVGEDGTYLK